MDFNNKHVVLIILVIIFFVFVYNYDVYVIAKGEALCKPIYVIKRELEPEILKELTDSEKVVINEAFTTDYFGNIDINDTNDNYQLPPKSLLSFHVPEVTDPNKTAIMDSVIKVISYIPTNITEDQIKEMLEYFGLIFQTSSSLEEFYKHVSSATKIKSFPYNTKYSQLILFLIGKFNNDYSFYKSKCNIKLMNTEQNLNPNKNVTQQYLNTSTANDDVIEPVIEEELEDNIISEIENELDSQLDNNTVNTNINKINKKKQNNPKKNNLSEPNKKGKISSLTKKSNIPTQQNQKERQKLNYKESTNDSYDEMYSNQNRKQKKYNNDNNNCNIDSFDNIVGNLDSYNSVNYENYASLY
jgi:hypothetical protein